MMSQSLERQNDDRSEFMLKVMALVAAQYGRDDGSGRKVNVRNEDVNEKTELMTFLLRDMLGVPREKWTAVPLGWLQ